MPSPVPRHIITDSDIARLPPSLRLHVCDLNVDARNGVRVKNARKHPAKYAPGLATELVRLASSASVGDPMCGVGTLAHETGLVCALNDIDPNLSSFHEPLLAQGCELSYVPAHEVAWSREVCVFSPPYYPRTDRRVPNAHNDAQRGPVVGFRDSYASAHEHTIGNPGGVDAILTYRQQMTQVYAHMTNVCQRMIVVTKNWVRLGVELRLDIDTILMAEAVGWRCVSRHGFQPRKSLWSRFNAQRGAAQARVGMVDVEDVLVFERRR